MRGEPGERGEEGAAERGCRVGHRVEQVACGAGGGGVGEEGVQGSGLEEAGEVGKAGLHSWQ